MSLPHLKPHFLLIPIQVHKVFLITIEKLVSIIQTNRLGSKLFRKVYLITNIISRKG